MAILYFLALSIIPSSFFSKSYSILYYCIVKVHAMIQIFRPYRDLQVIFARSQHFSNKALKLAFLQFHRVSGHGRTTLLWCARELGCRSGDTSFVCSNSLTKFEIHRPHVWFSTCEKRTKFIDFLPKDSFDKCFFVCSSQ